MQFFSNSQLPGGEIDLGVMDPVFAQDGRYDPEFNVFGFGRKPFFQIGFQRIAVRTAIIKNSMTSILSGDLVGWGRIKS
jgi:hypothetical protein